ncbi:vWA domain-containing protein [Halodesulfurarchaeum sp.]|uniref:vWA domain-containing protein n=1 Tax=Halodesulfurarchaeum sp. TaxID=1980530 RepID=UPI002FC30299
MTDNKRFYHLSRRSVLAGIGGVGLASAGAGLGTSAFLNDRETFENSTITAGTLDLLVDYYSYWDQGMAGTGQVHGTQDGSGTVSGVLDDVKPGDSGLLAFCPRIETNPAYLWLCGEITANSENGYTEPEPETAANGDLNDPGVMDGAGELAESIEVTVSYCDLDDDIADDGDDDDANDGFDPSDVTSVAKVWTGTFAELMTAIRNGVPLDGGGAVPGDAGFHAPGNQACFVGSASEMANPCLCLEWHVPTEVGNEIQGDSLSFDLEFHAEQCRNNDGTHNPCAGDGVERECPDCAVDTSATQSPEITVQSTNASSFPQVSTFLEIDTTSGQNGDLTAGDFALCEAGCGQDLTVDFTSEGKQVDFVFLMDVTGSMGGELEGMKTNVQDFIDDVVAEGLNARYALYLFGDDDEEYTGPPAVFLKQDFTANATTFKNSVQNTSLGEEVGYGGDTPEDNYEAILTADNDLSFRTGSQRVMIDITDAPSDEDPDQTIGGLAETRANAVSVLDEYTYFAVSYDVDEEEPDPHQKKELAKDVDGTWIMLGEDMGPILDEIQSEVATSYRVNYTTANPVTDGTARDIVIEISDPDEGTLYATTQYTAPS